MIKRVLCVLTAVCIILTATSGLCGEAESYDSRADKVVTGMTQDQKIGQVLLVNFRQWKESGKEELSDVSALNPEIASVIDKYHTGNIILFGENARNTRATARLTSDIQSCAKSAGDLPVLIGIDQEGGNVTRLGQGTCLAGNMALGATGNLDYAYQTGRVISSELSSLGIYLDFAPDADVNDNPNNPIIGLRSFGSDPYAVADMAQALFSGLKDSGVIGCAKHFPGHGNTESDTHTGLAIVGKTREEWLECEAVPFKKLIDSGIDMVMSAHIQYPNLDSTLVKSKLTGESIYLPATLSQRILTETLRGELGFDGVICTDAMDMLAIANHFGETQAVVMALNAGVDLICNPTKTTCLEDVEKLEAVYQAIRNAISTGELAQSRLDDAAKRVIKLKLKYGIIDKEYLSGDEQADLAASVVGCEENRTVEREIAQAAVTRYGSSETIEKAKEGDEVFIAVPYENEGNSALFAANRLMNEGAIPNVNVNIACYNKLEKLSDEIISGIRSANRVIIVTEASASTIADRSHWINAMPSEMLKKAREAGKDAVIVNAGLPYDAANYADYAVFIVYGNVGMTKDDAINGAITAKYGPNIPAGIGAALGAKEAAGTLPVGMN